MTLVPDKMLRELTERATRLAEQVELATRRSTNQGIRREGARFGEVLEEWLDQIKELRESNDETLKDTVNSFNKRLRIAESKVEKWFAATPGAQPALLAAAAAHRQPKRRNRSIPVVRKKAS